MLRTIEKIPDKKLSFHFQLTIRATREKVFEALTKSSIIDLWGAGPSRVQAKLHGNISFWDGEVFGNIREIKAPELLVYTMRHQNWENVSRESLITWKLDTHPRGTILYMTHNDLPNQKICEIQEEFWASSFLGPLKAYLEG